LYSIRTGHYIAINVFRKLESYDEIFIWVGLHYVAVFLYCVMRCQVELLTEIWRDYHQETLCRPIRHRLPEPPDQRQMLKAEIKFFIQSIQEKAKAHGRFVANL